MNWTSAFQRRVTAVLPGPAGSRVVPIGTACLAVLAALSIGGCNGDDDSPVVTETRQLQGTSVTGFAEGPLIYTDQETGQTFHAWDNMRALDVVGGSAELPDVRQIRFVTLDTQHLDLESGYPERDFMSDDIGVTERWSGMGQVRWQQRNDADQWQPRTSVAELTLTVRFLVDRDGDGLSEPAWLPCYQTGEDDGNEVCYDIAVTMFNPFPGVNPEIEIAGKSNDQPLVEDVNFQEYAADEVTLSVLYPQGVLALRIPSIKHVFEPTQYWTPGGLKVACLAAAIDPGLNVSVDRIRAYFGQSDASGNKLSEIVRNVSADPPTDGIYRYEIGLTPDFGLPPPPVEDPWSGLLWYEWRLEYTGPGEITEAIVSAMGMYMVSQVVSDPVLESICR